MFCLIQRKCGNSLRSKKSLSEELPKFEGNRVWKIIRAQEVRSNWFLCGNVCCKKCSPHCRRAACAAHCSAAQHGWFSESLRWEIQDKHTTDQWQRLRAQPWVNYLRCCMWTDPKFRNWTCCSVSVDVQHFPLQQCHVYAEHSFPLPETLSPLSFSNI